jgi:branched-chain amino acid transport system substrate-binding protein
MVKVKKIITVLLGLLLMLFCFASCTQKDDANTEQPTKAQESQTTEEAETQEQTEAPEQTQEPANTDPIKVGSISGVYGPIDAMVSCKAVQMYFDEVNEAGGVNGRPLELTFYDDGLLDPAVTLMYSQKLVEEDEVIAIVGPFLVLTWQGVEEYYIEQAIPVIGADGVHTGEYDSPVSFPLNQSPTDWGTTDAKFAQEVLEAKTIAVVYTQGLGYCEAWAQSIKDYISANDGVELASDCAVQNGEVNYTPYVLQLKEAKADVVCFLVGEAVYPGFYQEMQRQDYDPVIVASPACMSTSVSDAVTENLVGTIASSAFDVTMDNETFAHYKALLDENYPDTVDNPYGFSSYLSAKLFVDTLMKMDPNDITAETIMDALNSTIDWESGATLPLTYTPDDHSSNCGRIYFKYQGDGVWDKISDWIEIDG